MTGDRRRRAWAGPGGAISSKCVSEFGSPSISRVFMKARSSTTRRLRRVAGSTAPGGQCDDRLVGLAHAALREQALVGPARGRIGREQHQPGGAAIDAVDRHQVVQAQGALESHQQGLLQVLAGRRDGQEMRLVDHQQMRIAPQHRVLEGHARLVRQGAVVVEALVRLVGALAVTARPCSSTTSAASKRASQVARATPGKRCSRKSRKVGQSPAGRPTQLGPTPSRVGSGERRRGRRGRCG